MAQRTQVRWRLVVVGVISLALLGPVATDAAIGRSTAPPANTFEVTITSGSVVAPGGTVSFSGICWVSGGGPTQETLIHGVRHAPLGSGLEPFDFSTTVSVNGSTGAFSGTITVPGDAPNGAYDLRSICSTQDQAFGVGVQQFTVDGPLITTTTTTSSTTTTTAVRPGLTAVPTPAPAQPLSGTAVLAG